MGIPFKLYEGKEVNLPAELTAGGIYFCEDSGNVFIDVDIDGTLTRVPLGKKYVDDQLVDIREFIENQGSGIEIGSEPPTKESANVWIDTDDGDEEGVEYLGVVTSINGKGGDINITASDIDAAEKTHASQHASGGSDPITAAAIGAMAHTVITQELLDNPAYPTAYIGSCFALSGLPFDGHWRVVYLPYHDWWEGYGSQIAVGAVTDEKMYVRNATGTTWGNWVQFATTDYAVNKAGDTIMGNLAMDTARPTVLLKDTQYETQATIQHADNTVAIGNFNKYGDASNRRQLNLFNSTQKSGLTDALWLIDIVDNAVSAYPILHTGNKPSGSYTGNGDATVRTIETGGIGNAVLVRMNAGGHFAIVTGEGAIVKMADGTIKGLPATQAKFANGVLTLATTESALNMSNWTHMYQVL